MYWCFEPGQLEKTLELYQAQLRSEGMPDDEAHCQCDLIRDYLYSDIVRENRLLIQPGEVQLSEPEGGNAETGE